MNRRHLLTPELEAAAAQCGFGCPRGVSGAVIGYLMAWTHGWRNTWALSLLDIQLTDRILEIGFGPGTEIKSVAQRAVRGFVGGVDPSEVMLRQASRRNRRYIRAGRVDLRLAPMSAIPFPDRGFNKVFGINSIHFSTDLLHDLEEIRRVLNPGGLAAFAVQPVWKGATDATALQVAHGLREAMMEAHFHHCRTEHKQSWPRLTVCVLGHK